MCQCPISGLLHFYDGLRMELKKEDDLCQCPISGLLHFYYKNEHGEFAEQAKVSMPYFGLTPFLRREENWL